MAQLDLTFSPGGGASASGAGLPAGPSSPSAAARGSADDATLRARFEAFHRENPSVFEKLRELALYARRRGAQRLSINLLFERLRWEIQIETRGDDFRLNNNHRPYYARLLMASEPELAGAFETRAAGDEEDACGGR